MAKERDGRDRDNRSEGLEERIIKIRRCAAVVKGGRRFSFNAMVVVGDRNGRVAWGYGKANEVPPAVEKAAKEAEKTLKQLPKISMKGATIPHRVVGKFGASKVILVPAGPGTGVKAGPGPQHPHQGSRQHQCDQPRQGDHRRPEATAHA